MNVFELAKARRLGVHPAIQALCLMLAVAVHEPHVVHWIGSLVGWLMAKNEDDIDSDLDSQVPMELDLDSQEVAVPRAPEPENQPLPKPDEEVVALQDAGPPPPKHVDAGPPPEIPDAAPPDAGPPADAGPPPVEEDPVAVVNTPNPSGNPNAVEIVIVGKNLRNHPVGQKMGQMLPTVRRWKDFFQDTGIDAVQDVDLMSLQGPEFRRRTDQVDTVMVFNGDMDRVKGALDKVLQRNDGQWIDGFAAPTGKAKIAGASRMFVLVKDHHLVYVTPEPRQHKRKKKDPDWTDDERREQEKKKVDQIVAFKEPNVNVPFALLLSVKEPGPLSKQKIKTPLGEMDTQFVPSTVEKFVVRVDALPGGAARVRLEFWEDNKDHALTDVSEIQSSWGTAQLGAGIALNIALPDLKFAANDRLVFAETTVDEAFLNRVFAIGEKMIADANARSD